MQNLEVKSLSNKLPLYCLKSTKAPVITLQVWVKTGSADELKTEAGLSHFIEHLLFKGTRKFAPGEIAQAVEAAGGELNAYTSFDQTVFYVTVPKAQFEVAALVLSEMLIHPEFDPEEIDNEREVVVEEIKMGMDQPGRVASKMLFNQMFHGHPYSLPVIGTEENIRRVSAKEIKDYFGERYVGDNMSLVCVGDFEENHLKIIEKHFDDLQFNGLPAKDRSRNNVNLPAERVSFHKSEFENDYFYISWPMKGYLSQDSETAELLALLMGQGESSFLYNELKLKRGLCRSIGASYFGGAEEGIFVINGVTMGDEITELFAVLPSVLKDFFKQEDIEESLLKARNIFDSEASYAAESISSLCRTIGDDWLYYNKPGAWEEKKNRILSLKENDLKTFSEKLLQTKPYLSVLSKQDLKKDCQELPESIFAIKDVQVNFQESKEKSKSKDQAQNEVHSQESETVWTSPKGNKVIFVPEKFGSVVSAKVAFEGGELLADDDQQGLVSLFGNLWTREFKGISEQDVAAKMDFYCSGFSAFAGKHSVGLSLTTLSKYFDHLSGFFEKALTEPVFSKSVMDREKESLVNQLKSRKDRPSAVAFKEFSKLIFKDHLYSRDGVGVVEHIEALKTEDIKSYFEKIVKQKCVFTIVGNLSLKQVENMVSSVESVLKPSGESLYLNRKESKVSEGETLKIETDKNQAHIILGYPGLNYSDERKIHLDLVSALLGGQGGRLFIELRDKASLAYSVAPLEYSGFLGGYFGGYIACDPAKTETAVKMMRGEFKKVITEGFTSEEMTWMRNQILGKFAMASQRNSFICDTVLFDALYGLEPFEYKSLEKKLMAIQPEDLIETMKNILNGPEFLVTVG